MANKKRRKNSLVWFYYEGKLHKVMRVSKPHDLVYAWCFKEYKMMTYIWSHIRRVAEGAWTTDEVRRMFGRSYRHMKRHMLEGNIPLPERAYSLNGRFQPLGYKWSEKDIYNLHDYLLGVHYGAKRLDGGITPYRNTPSRPELRAMLKKDAVDYYVLRDGEMVKAWKENEW